MKRTIGLEGGSSHMQTEGIPLFAPVDRGGLSVSQVVTNFHHLDWIILCGSSKAMSLALGALVE